MTNYRKLVAIYVFIAVIGSMSYGRAQALNEAFLNSTVFLSYNVEPNQLSFGTGFLVFRPIDSDKGHVWLVTNKHVLPPLGREKNLQLRVKTQSGDKTSIKSVEIPIVGADGKYFPTVVLHTSPDFDVVAINITDTIVKNNISATWLPFDLLATKEIIKREDITVGDDIFLLGYPSAIFDQRNPSPLLRQGVIASVPIEGYAFNDSMRQNFKLPSFIDGFLIDANVFPGSSGSVVILKQQATTIGMQGETVVSGKKKVPYILGIVSGSIPIVDSNLGSVQRMALGIVYSADCIRDTINKNYPVTK